MRLMSVERTARRWVAPVGAICLSIAAVSAVAEGRSTDLPTRSVDGKPVALTPPEGGATALVFLSTECPISNAYSPKLNAIAEGRGPANFALVGVCVDPDKSTDEVARFAGEYGLKFPIVLDRSGRLAAKFGVKVTPEAVVLDHAEAVRYRGRIDDTYAARGKRKPNPTTDELADAVAAVLAGKAVAAPEVEAVGCPLPVPPAAPAKPTFAKDVATILQANCQQCHRPGQVGPFPLVTYEQARKRASDIADVVTKREMPPWKPDPAVGPGFKYCKALTDSQVATIAAWAEAGAPEGDPADLPKPPTYADGWQLGTPDLIVEAPESFDVPAQGDDVYRCFVIPTDLPGDVAISAIEYQPENRKVVHHILAYMDTTGKARELDAKDPGLGYSCFSGPGVEVHGDLGGWAPGNEPSFLPEGIGRLMPRKADVVMQVHYHPSGKPEKDRSRIGLYFSKTPIKQTLHWNAVINRALRIPPGAANFEVEAGWKVPQFGWEAPVDLTALAITPHMHMIGKDMTLTVTYPDGRNEDLIRINDWDFNWQNTYYFKEPLDLPKGAILKLRAHFDNSKDNPRNPNNPPKQVTWGEATTDEMCIGFLGVVKKGQDLTKPGEKDDLRQIFDEQGQERRKFAEEFYKKARAEAEKKKAEAEKAGKK